MFPEWLLGSEDYSPRYGRDAFIDKSILSLLRVLSLIRSQGGRREERIRINPVVKLVSILLLILLLSLSNSLFFVTLVGTFLLVLLSLQRGELILKVLRVSLPVAAFTFVILLPSAIGGNAASAVVITAKVLISVTTVKLFSTTTEWGSITSALKVLLIPDLFILVLDITVRYIALLGEFSLHMLYALKLRSIGKNKGKAASLSGIAGTLFLKAREMGEEMYAAMECRGFSGTYKFNRTLNLILADFILIAIDGFILTVFFLSGA